MKESRNTDIFVLHKIVICFRQHVNRYASPTVLNNSKINPFVNVNDETAYRRSSNGLIVYSTFDRVQIWNLVPYIHCMRKAKVLFRPSCLYDMYISVVVRIYGEYGIFISIHDQHNYHLIHTWENTPPILHTQDRVFWWAVSAKKQSSLRVLYSRIVHPNQLAAQWCFVVQYCGLVAVNLSHNV